MCGGLVEVGICEALDKPESDSQCEVTLLLTMRNSRVILKLIDLGTVYVCVCVFLHYLVFIFQ